MFNQEAFKKRHDGEGGEDNNINNDVIQKIFDRSGACVMGKRMFDEGEANWPENAPFRMDVFVLTHERRELWKRPGGTTFYFVNDGIDSAMNKAKKSAKEKDVRICGGGDTIQQYLNAGYVDEFCIHVAPIILVKGLKLLDKIEKDKFTIEIEKALNSDSVTHLFYKVKNNQL
jgi:dihydrofolate reductase